VRSAPPPPISFTVPLMQPPRTLALATLLGVALMATPAAAADPDPAEVSFNRGLEHMNAGRFAQACPLLEESFRLDPLPGTLFALADCEKQRGRIATAVARCDAYIAMVETLPPDKKVRHRDRERDARAWKAELVPQIPRLVLTLPQGAPAGTVVKRDGVALGPSEIDAAVELDPGEHVVTTQAPGGPVTEVVITIGAGERKEVELAVKTPVTSPAPEQGQGPDVRTIVMYGAAGLGAAGLLVGGITGVLALGQRGVMDEPTAWGGTSCSGAACTAEGKRAASSLKTLGLVSTIGFGAGAAGLGAAAVLFFTAPSASAAKTARHPRVHVIISGDGGAALHVRGVW
jgi:hypothetical protein